MKFAAIDIGSNAVRLLLARVFEQDDGPFIKKESLVRMPIRLGDDSFLRKTISDKKIDQLSKTMLAFNYLIQAYEPLDYVACATSALRDASNSTQVITKITEYSGIQLKIIDGKEEANIIFSNHFEKRLNQRRTYLYIDVGGGSTELTLFDKKKMIASQSFNIGTIRLLNDIVTKQQWNELKTWIKTYCTPFKSISAIGSGGNINKIFRLSASKENQPMDFETLSAIYLSLRRYSYEERIYKLGLRPDRSDVIIPAAKIYHSVMKWSKIKNIYVPQIGLADGLVHILYNQYRNRSQA